MEAFNRYRFEQGANYFPAYGAHVVMANSSGPLDWRDAANDFRAKNGIFLLGESSGVYQDGRKWIEFRCTSQPADRYPVKSLQRGLPRRPSDFRRWPPTGIPDAERAAEMVSLKLGSPARPAPAQPQPAPAEEVVTPKAA